MITITDNDCWSDSWGPIQVGCCLDTDPLFSTGKLTWRSLRQVHGAVVFDDTTWKGPSQEGDGLTSIQADTVLLIRTADCVPVHITDGHRIAMLHAGWRSTEAGIVADLGKLFDISKVRVWIGPSIYGKNYEVDNDLYADWLSREPALAAFLHEHKPGTSKRQLNLRGYITAQLQTMGVPQENLTMVPVCTFDSSLPSYRRQGKAARRIINYIWRAS